MAIHPNTFRGKTGSKPALPPLSSPLSCLLSPPPLPPSPSLPLPPYSPETVKSALKPKRRSAVGSIEEGHPADAMITKKEAAVVKAGVIPKKMQLPLETLPKAEKGKANIRLPPALTISP